MDGVDGVDGPSISVQESAEVFRPRMYKERKLYFDSWKCLVCYMGVHFLPTARLVPSYQLSIEMGPRSPEISFCAVETLDFKLADGRQLILCPYDSRTRIYSAKFCVAEV